MIESLTGRDRCEVRDGLSCRQKAAANGRAAGGGMKTQAPKYLVELSWIIPHAGVDWVLV